MRVAFLLPASVFVSWAAVDVAEHGMRFDGADAGLHQQADRSSHLARQLIDLGRWTRTAPARLWDHYGLHAS